MATAREAGVNLPRDQSAVANWLNQIESIDLGGQLAWPRPDVGIQEEKLVVVSSDDADTNRSSCPSNSETGSSFS